MQKKLRTIEIAANLCLGRDFTAETAEWASTLIDEGYISPSVVKLANVVQPFNFFETRPVVEEVLRELSVKNFNSQAEATYALTSILAKQCLSGEISPGAAVNEISQLYNDWGMDSILQDFYLLFWAKQDLKEGNYSFHWQGATDENIDEIIRKKFGEWLNKYPI